VSHRRPRSRFVSVVALVALALAGCREKEQVHTITVSRSIEEENAKLAAEWRAKAQTARPAAPQGEAKPGRLLGALLPHAGQTWIFKMLGDADAVGRHVEEVKKFVEGVKFVGDKPQWTLPPSWREESTPGSMRYATLFVEEGSGAPLELAVSALPGEQSVADNVNRWRGQVQLAAQTAAEIEQETATITTPAGPARWVDLSGKYVPGGGGMGPFAGGAGPRSGAGPRAGAGGPAMPADHPPIAPPANAPTAQAAAPRFTPPADSPIKYDLPKGWQPSPPSQFSIAAFTVVDEGRQARITVSSASGDLLSNINRWRGQLQLPPIDQNTLDSAVTKLKVDGRDATYVELLGPSQAAGQQAIYGAVIADAPPSSWFVKMTSDASLAMREREHFQQFILSLKFVRP
jgi:hypothetical protein